MGKDKEQEADLRKEVEMTEHKDSVDKVADQFDLDLVKGLNEEQVLEVPFLHIFPKRQCRF